MLRPAQFATIGAVCAVVQLGLLAVFTERTNFGSVSNAVAFLISAQLNFALNSALTWRDRMHRRPMALFAQALGFNALILVAVVFNQAIYLVAVRLTPYLVAGAVGLGATTLAKYFIADRWIFRTGKHNLRAVVPAPDS
jgi:putative flippase GtrA